MKHGIGAIPRGVTLIELMVVVVIIAILAGVAYPSYQSWLMETKRSDAHIALTQLANDMEKFYSECGSYPTNITATTRSCTSPSGPPPGSLGRGANGDLSPDRHYRLSIAVAGGGYTLTATPIAGGEMAADRDCTTITLSSTGQKGATGAKTARCWRK